MYDCDKYTKIFRNHSKTYVMPGNSEIIYKNFIRSCQDISLTNTLQLSIYYTLKIFFTMSSASDSKEKKINLPKK